MDHIINRQTLTNVPATGRIKALLAGFIARFDRLEAAIGVAQAHRSHVNPHRADLQTLGFPRP